LLAGSDKGGYYSIFDRLHEESFKKLEYKNQIEELKILNDLKECTFQPQLNLNTGRSMNEMTGSVIGNEKDNLNSSRSHYKTREEFFSHLTKSGTKAYKANVYERMKEEQELRDCTFQPVIPHNRSQSKERLQET